MTPAGIGVTVGYALGGAGCIVGADIVGEGGPTVGVFTGVAVVPVFVGLGDTGVIDPVGFGNGKPLEGLGCGLIGPGVGVTPTTGPFVGEFDDGIGCGSIGFWRIIGIELLVVDPPEQPLNVMRATSVIATFLQIFFIEFSLYINK